MTKMNSVSRRSAMTSIGSGLFFAITSQRVLAGGDGGNAADKAQEEAKKNRSKKKKSQDEKAVLITQDYFKRLSRKGLRELIEMIDSGQDARVQGFSESFSRHLFETALTDKDFVVQVIQGIRPFRTVKERKDYLRDLAYEVENPFEDLVQPAGMSREEFEASIARQETPELIRQRKTKVRLVKKWIWAPRQGMLTN